MRRSGVQISSGPQNKNCHKGSFNFVGMEGIEPSTSVLSGQRSTTELAARPWMLVYHTQNFRKIKMRILSDLEIQHSDASKQL